MEMAIKDIPRLNNSQIELYKKEGFIVVENLVSPEILEQLKERISEYTHGGRDHENIRIQLEPKVKRGDLSVCHLGDAIRKIDGLVEGDDLFNKLGSHENIVSVIEQILGPDLKMFRNAMLLKPPLVGSAKGMHQDSPYWPIAPMDLCSCWFPLDDATLENGCMGVIPGAHKLGELPHINITDDFVVDKDQYNMDDVVFKPMKAGSGLFFHSLLPHYTAPNLSKNWRRSIALSYMSSRSTYSGEGVGPQYLHIKGNTFPDCVR
jgi:phytanoyl-CoA hydroxylase